MAKTDQGASGKGSASSRRSSRGGKKRRSPEEQGEEMWASLASDSINEAGLGLVTVRHYCQGIGDSHLLGFPKDDGDMFWMLIDCGIHSSVSGGSKTMDTIVADIAEQTGGVLDVLVVTHEHMDHVSAFLTASDRFAKFTVRQVWMAWTEDEKDPQAKQIDKFKRQAIEVLRMTSLKLNGAAGSGGYLSELGRSVDQLMGFHFGVKGERVRRARDAAKALCEGGAEKVLYCEPNDPPMTLAGVPNVRVYVLGPPRSELLGVTDRKSEMYELGGAPSSRIAMALSRGMGMLGDTSGDQYDAYAPFDAHVGANLKDLLDGNAIAFKENDAVEKREAENLQAIFRDRYFGASPQEGDQSWRRIDLDWLGVSADLAMQLDDKTNNSSLVLAFELIDTGRVLLFAGDAQIGNWLSWQDVEWRVGDKVVRGPDLLKQTVYYKVAHHGSENATAKQKGLELMTNKDLCAFVPTNAVDAANVGWKKMPFDPILKALDERCRGRVNRADDPQPNGDGGTSPKKGGSIKAVDRVDGLWVEVKVR